MYHICHTLHVTCPEFAVKITQYNWHYWHTHVYSAQHIISKTIYKLAQHSFTPFFHTLLYYHKGHKLPQGPHVWSQGTCSSKQILCTVLCNLEPPEELAGGPTVCLLLQVCHPNISRWWSWDTAGHVSGLIALQYMYKTRIGGVEAHRVIGGVWVCRKEEEEEEFMHMMCDAGNNYYIERILSVHAHKTF